MRFYQEIAVNNVMAAIVEEKQRIVSTLATGKTFIAFQIAWEFFQTRWNLRRQGSMCPHILFLAGRNILANQGCENKNAVKAVKKVFMATEKRDLIKK